MQTNSHLCRRDAIRLLLATSFVTLAANGTQAQSSSTVLFQNVRVFDGTSDRLSAATSVLVEGDKIKKIAPSIDAPSGALVEALTMATATNGQLLALSGLRNPYPGKIGVVEEGALADLLLVEGDPLSNIRLIEDPEKNFVIMKDGEIYKNALGYDRRAGPLAETR